jgi:hypothetical protein
MDSPTFLRVEADTVSACFVDLRFAWVPSGRESSHVADDAADHPPVEARKR